MRDKDDLTIAWSKDKHAEMVEHIQALMDKGVTFHRIETRETGKIRKKLVPTATPIASTDQIQDRRLLITDAEIKKLVYPALFELCQNFGIEPPPPRRMGWPPRNRDEPLLGETDRFLLFVRRETGDVSGPIVLERCDLSGLGGISLDQPRNRAFEIMPIDNRLCSFWRRSRLRRLCRGQIQPKGHHR